MKRFKPVVKDESSIIVEPRAAATTPPNLPHGGSVGVLQREEPILNLVSRSSRGRFSGLGIGEGWAATRFPVPPP